MATRPWALLRALAPLWPLLPRAAVGLSGRLHADAEEVQRQPVPHEHEVYVGNLMCGLETVGIRAVIEEAVVYSNRFISERRAEKATITIWPRPHPNLLVNRWCPPTTVCNGSIVADISKDLMSGMITFSVPEGLCETPNFRLLGGTSERTPKNAPLITGIEGDISPPLTIRSGVQDEDMPEASSPACTGQTKRYTQGKGMFKTTPCRTFILERCKTRRPKQNEKVIYMMLTYGSNKNAPRNIAGYGDSHDHVLDWDKAMKEVLHVQYHPVLKHAVSMDVGRRAQAVMVAPSAHAMQTAIIALGHAEIKIHLDVNLLDGRDEMIREHGEAVIREGLRRGLLAEKQAKDLLWQYDQALTNTTIYKDNVRMAVFMETMVNMHFERLALVIGGVNLFTSIGNRLPPEGTVSARILSADHKFYDEEFDPDCFSVPLDLDVKKS